jgi:Slime mold cyclic AMP receptor
MSLSVAALGMNQILIKVAASLSFLGSLSIIISYSTMKEFRLSSNRLVFFMSFYDLLGSIGTGIAKYGYSQGENTGLCQFQATIIHVGLLGGILWSACMATNLILKFTLNMSMDELKEFEKFYHLFVIIGSALPAAAMLVMNNTGTPILGNAQIWCWISNPYSSIRIYAFYLPLWIVFIYNLVVYVYIYMLIKSATVKFATNFRLPSKVDPGRFCIRMQSILVFLSSRCFSLGFGVL